jgi:hypothetical protein
MAGKIMLRTAAYPSSAMRVSPVVLMFAWWALSGASAQAIDGSAIERSLVKEPRYQSADPQYCLLVLGPEAKIRVWVVLDGDVLYLDRNGNGDLTESGERLLPKSVLLRSETRPDAEVLRTFNFALRDKPFGDTGATTLLPCFPNVAWLHVFQLVPRTDTEEGGQSPWRDRPIRVAMALSTGWEQDAQVAFAGRPQDAPILPFFGRQQIALNEPANPLEFHRGEAVGLLVSLVTRGRGGSVRTSDGPPEGAHPVAEVVFPPRSPGAAPLVRRFDLATPC